MSDILVTGGDGMVGKHLREILPEANYISRSEYDLNNYEHVKQMMIQLRPRRVIHLAAKVGGIQENLQKPAEFFDDNVRMNMNILSASKNFNVRYFTSILSSCAYPDCVDTYPMTEDQLFDGPPAYSNFSYGYAKRAMAVQIDAYNKQYDTKYNYLIPCNLFSEFDNYDNNVKMHFITALLKKIKTSDNELRLLGTGKPLRQFMYAGDLARIIKEVVDKNITENFNVAPNHNYSINDMAMMALKISQKDLKIVYSDANLDGQYRKDVDNTKLHSLINFEFSDFQKKLKEVYDKISF